MKQQRKMWKTGKWKIDRFNDFPEILTMTRCIKFKYVEKLSSRKIGNELREILECDGCFPVIADIDLPDFKTCQGEKINYLTISLTFNSNTKDIDKQKLITKNLNEKFEIKLDEYEEFKGNWNNAN